MKLSTKSEYSLLILIYLARQWHAPGYTALETICSHYQIPLKYAEQLIGVLKQNRFVNARRGSAGGYRLSKPPENISIAEVIRLMDGALAPTAAVSRYFFEHTPIEKEAKMIDLLKGIRNHIAAILENTTLSQLV